MSGIHWNVLPAPSLNSESNRQNLGKPETSHVPWLAVFGSRLSMMGSVMPLPHSSRVSLPTAGASKVTVALS